MNELGGFVVAFYVICRYWQSYDITEIMDVREFLAWPLASAILLSLLGIAIAGGMFVVPLYAFLTTRCPPDQAARTIAANNIVNSGAMVGGSLVAMAMSAIGIAVAEQLLLSAAMCLFSAWLGQRLYRAELDAEPLPA